MKQYIPLAVGGILLLFLLAGMIWGLIRGLKKTAFRTGWVVITAVIMFFIAPLVTAGIMKMNISFIGINLGGEVMQNLNQLATYYLNQIPEFGQVLTANPETLTLLLQVVSLLVNAFIYVILFWLAKIILWPIWAILSATLIKKKDAKGEKKKKHAGFGLLVGTVLGLFVGGTTIMPVLGLVNLVTEIETSTTSSYSKTITNSETGETETIQLNGGFISKMGGEEFVEILDYYNNSFMAKTLKYTGIEFLSNATFAGLSTTKIDNQKVTLKNEVKNVVLTLDTAKLLQGLSFTNLTKQKVATIIDTSELLVNRLFNIKIIGSLGNNLMPEIINEILNNPNFIIKLPATGTPLFDQAIKDGITDLNEVQFTDLKHEMLTILNIAKTLNNKDIISKVANKEVTKAEDILKLLDETTINLITDDVFKMKTMSSLLPIAVNTSLDFLAEKLEITDFEIDHEKATVEEVKTLFKNLLTTVYSINNSLDLNSKYYITETTLPLAGKLLNSVKNYGGLNNENYLKIVNAVETKAKNELEKMLNNVSADLQSVKNEIINSVHNLSEIENFEQDFSKINEVYDDLISVLNGINATTPEIKLMEIGNVLDCFKQTTLFGSAVNPIISGGLDFFKTKIPADYADLLSIVDRVKGNVSKVSVWKKELTTLESFINVTQDIFAASDLKNALLSESSTLMSDLGESLNTLNSSTLFGSEIKNIVKAILGQVEKVSIENAELLSESFAVVKTNIDSATEINWKTEFITLKNLMNNLMSLADSSSSSTTIEEIGRTFDNIIASNSVLINREVINTILQTTITQFAGTVEAGSDLEDIVNTIKTAIEDNDSLNYEQELTALNSLFNEITNIDTSTLNFATFGELLDSYDAETGTTKSVIVSAIRPKIVTMVINKVDTTNMDEKMVQIINKIKANVSTIVSYKDEFTILDDFITTVDGLVSVDVDTFEFGEFGSKLDSYANSKLIGNVRSDVLSFIVDMVVIENGQSEIATAINEILANTKLLGAKAQNGEITFNTIFSEIGLLKSKTTALESISISKQNHNVTSFGTILDELNALNIVPTVAAVRIAKCATSQIVGINGVDNIMPDYSDSPYATQINEVYNTAMSDISAINAEYTSYIAKVENNENPTNTFNFAEDFETINNTINSIIAVLQTAGLWE